MERNCTIVLHFVVALLRKRLGARLPPVGSRVRISVPSWKFRDGRNGVWVGFSRGFSCFPQPQILFHHFFTLILSISFHFISSAPAMARQACSAGTFAIHWPSIYGFIASHPSTRPCVGHELSMLLLGLKCLYCERLVSPSIYYRSRRGHYVTW